MKFNAFDFVKLVRLQTVAVKITETSTIDSNDSF